MHEFQTVVWLEAPCDVPSKASRPVLSGRCRPLPASLFRFSPGASPITPLYTRSRSDQLGCGRPLCAGWFESFRLFSRVGESSVSGLTLFTSLNLKLCARYIMYMYILVHAALQAPCRIASSFRFLIALIDPAILTQSGKSNHSAWSPGTHPGKSPLFHAERSRTAQAIDEQRCGMVFSVDTAAHAPARP